jgi:hypothetical protein
LSRLLNLTVANQWVFLSFYITEIFGEALIVASVIRPSRKDDAERRDQYHEEWPKCPDWQTRYVSFLGSPLV